MNEPVAPSQSVEARLPRTEVLRNGHRLVEARCSPCQGTGNYPLGGGGSQPCAFCGATGKVMSGNGWDVAEWLERAYAAVIAERDALIEAVRREQDGGTDAEKVEAYRAHLRREGYSDEERACLIEGFIDGLNARATPAADEPPAS